MFLGNAIVSHRYTGRPTGDVDTAIGDGFVVTSSLAAAIAEFHYSIINAYAVLWCEKH